MNLNEWSLLCGMAGTILLAVTPVKIEWIRYITNTKGQIQTDKIKDPVVLEIVTVAQETTERLIVASWSRGDAFVLILGLVLLMLSYALPFFWG
jgi:hypothetical protein